MRTRTRHTNHPKNRRPGQPEGVDDGTDDRTHVPRNGPARALWEAASDEPISDILARVPRWECDGCGAQKFSVPPNCTECQGTTFHEVTP